MNYVEITQILPHRYPFLFVDQVLELEKGKRIKAIKNVSANEPFFQGHFPEFPLMPGVLQIEALAQAGGLLMGFNPENQVAFLTGVSEAKFRRLVVPGDQLDLDVELLMSKHGVCRFKGVATVKGECACEALLTVVVKAR